MTLHQSEIHFFIFTNRPFFSLTIGSENLLAFLNRSLSNIYDIYGNVIDNLYDGYIQSGQHTLEWNASQQSSGVYLIRAKYQNNIFLKKAILIK